MCEHFDDPNDIAWKSMNKTFQGSYGYLLSDAAKTFYAYQIGYSFLYEGGGINDYNALNAYVEGAVEQKESRCLSVEEKTMLLGLWNVFEDDFV